MAKTKVETIKSNKNNEFDEDDTDIEQDIKTLGQIRDSLFNEFKCSVNVIDKISIASQISSIVHARQQSELFFLRLAGVFDRNHEEDDYCEGCPECDAELAKGNDEAN